MVSSKNMTSGPPLTILFKFTVPLLLGNLLQQTYSIVDAVIVGKSLGINSLAAVGAGTSVITLILGFCSGCCGGFGIPMAQKFGAQDFATLYKYIIISLKISAVISVAIASTTSIL
ncbi:MATE family efflux transporter, partial [Phocaeicola barnesiae]|uniref:MATE family efflux transporter n=1 Tax=Phocaeicola barnesiae TaxID=376804 RepID=UPI00293EFD1E